MTASFSCANIFEETRNAMRRLSYFQTMLLRKSRTVCSPRIVPSKARFVEIVQPAIWRHPMSSLSTERMGSRLGRLDIKWVVPLARSVRVIHKPCRGLTGSRFTASSDHRRQKKHDENIRILTMIANGAGIHDMRRILRSPRDEAEPEMSRLYDRIFWLERTEVVRQIRTAC